MSDVEGVFLVRLRQITGATRVEEVRASAWPATRVMLRDLGYFAEAVRLVRTEPRAEVPFPLRLHAEGPEDPDRLARLRQITRAFTAAAALVADKPRRAEGAMRALEPELLPLGPEAAAALWIEAAAAFHRVGDEERADRMLGHLAALARRVHLDAALLGRAALPGEDGAPFHPDLLEVAALRAAQSWGPSAALSLRLEALRRRLGAGRRLPAGALRALERAADAVEDRADARARVDAALLGMAGLAGAWAADPEAAELRARIEALWARTYEAADRGAAARAAVAEELRAALPGLDRAGLQAATRLLLAAPPGASRGESETKALAAALAQRWQDPASRPFLAALLADLDAATPGLSDTLAALAPSPLGPPEGGPPPRHGTRAALHLALARWMPPSLVPAARAAFAAGNAEPDLDSLAPSPPAAWASAVRLLGLAQDERTPAPLAEHALALADALCSRAPAPAGRDEPRASHPGGLHVLGREDIAPAFALSSADRDALRAGIATTRALLAHRRDLHPSRWPAPALDHVSTPGEARLVLLTWALGRLDARDASTSHLRLARIADATPLVRAELGRLVPARPPGRTGAPSALARLASTALVRVPDDGARPLGDLVLLAPPRRFAEAFAADLGLSPDALTAPEPPAAMAASSPPPRADLAFLDPSRVPDEASLAALLAPAPHAPAPAPAPEPISTTRIAGHLLAVGPDGELRVTNARGEPLRHIPAAVRKDEAYRALVRGRRDDRARARQALRDLEARMTSAEPIAGEALAWLLDDPVHAALLRYLVMAPAASTSTPPEDAGLVWAWDQERGLGVLPLDYDARWLGWIDVELLHPARLPNLAAWRALLSDLGVRQELAQLSRERASLPPAELERTESLRLAGRTARSAASLRLALAAEGFRTGPGLARRSFSHYDANGRTEMEAWFDPGGAPWPGDPCTSGAFGFRDRQGVPLALSAVPAPILHEAQRSIERALARAAPRSGR
ncbi:DUF4132 domain-containing protein [Polyangium aurulentum]|uniref:DUF4132 domain-containing protein n=1 Tax=Polyangium aurulentum TaxID=2567896 RepID=UPI0010AE75C7|nr:DUF4132 domain-containing protein [Polyangium aurulentum]UQA59095.1 DUF4132 domain-containing protein [Polyangium aurulentum]